MLRSRKSKCFIKNSDDIRISNAHRVRIYCPTGDNITTGVSGGFTILERCKHRCDRHGQLVIYARRVNRIGCANVV